MTEKSLEDLAKQVTPFDAFDALVYGVSSEAGRRFIDLYAEVCRLRGDKVERREDGKYDITPKAKQ